MNESIIFLAAGGVLALSMGVALITARIGVPSLIAFMLIGVLFGNEGAGIIPGVSEDFARIAGTLGLAAILFEGGLSTSRRRLREVAIPASLLSTVGVAVTAILAGLAAKHLFDLTWLQAFLLGAVVSSTDAAAVFATLRFTKIRRNLARTLEAESGGNDPMAIALTVGLIVWIQDPTYNLGNLFTIIISQLGVGFLVGALLGALAMYMFARLPHSVGAFAPVASLSALALSFGIADVLGGSGFLAVYMVGLAIGSTPSRYRSQMAAFHEGLAFVAQVVMFVILGLLIVPSELVAVGLAGFALSLLLVILIRPLAVWASTFFLNFNNKERALLGWAGLRGAVPIVLGTIVLSSHIENAELIFNIVFFVVLVSALIQGTTLERIASRLGLTDEPTPNRSKRSPSSRVKIKFEIASHHAIAGVAMREVGLPHQARIVRITRDGINLNFRKETILQVDDQLTIDAPRDMYPEIEDVFTRWRRRI